MIKTSIAISSDGKETGTLLREYLQARGVYSDKGPALVCYGTNGMGSPALNASCRSDKIKRMQAMGKAGVRLVPWAIGREAFNLQLPLFARKLYGYGAKDLMPVFQADEIPWRIAAGWEWFSSIVPIHQELRVWVWRDEVLQGFAKRMRRPADYKSMGRNFGQGFEFEPITILASGDIGQQAIRATKALHLDFSAIDMIEGEDGHVYTLEANTAPGAIRSGAQDTLAALADRIADWAQNDCPARSGATRIAKTDSPERS